MRSLQERVENSQLVHHLQCRGVDGVAAEVSQEISVLFEDDHFHPGAGEKEAKHHAGWPSADDTAPHVHLMAWRRLLLHLFITSGILISP